MGTVGFIFKLLQVAIGNRKELPRQLTDDEWGLLYAVSEQHNVLDVAFSAIQKLPDEQRPSLELFAKWQKDAQIEKERRERIIEICRKACETHEKNGFDSCVLMPTSVVVRGERLEVRDERLEGSAQTEEVRGKRFEVRGGDPKDIDILCWSKDKKDGKRTIVEYVNFQYVASTHHIKPKVVRHRVNFESGNIPVEVRFKFSYFNSPLHDRRFLAWVEKKVLSESPQKGKDGYPIPSDTFNAVYQLIHLYRKLFCEGLRLGHLYDYYMVLRSLPSSEHEEVMRVIGRLGMKKFAGAVMYVMQSVFGMPEEYFFCKPIARNGSFVISITMQAGEYTRAIERTRMLKHLGRIGHHLYWLKRNRPFLTQYPAEACFELYRRIRG